MEMVCRWRRRIQREEKRKDRCALELVIFLISECSGVVILVVCVCV